MAKTLPSFEKLRLEMLVWYLWNWQRRFLFCPSQILTSPYNTTFQKNATLTIILNFLPSEPPVAKVLCSL